MATRQGNKISLDDNNSFESISFAGLLPKHEQQQQQQQQQKFSSSNQVHYKSQASFEFRSTAGVDSKFTSPIKSSPADVLMANGKLVPHSFAVQSEHIGSSRTVHQTNEIRSTNSPKIKKSFDHKPHLVNRQVEGEKKVKKSWLSVLCCRESHAISPTMKAQNLSEEHSKSK